ncbi:hypothetical protein CVT26_008105 [Gymnopilus dilepis]|uniref:Uncharacterized protein n=1 Tax=Gymnopilus dilepis TaxID=231916 RepID=A0A409WWG0_9AGAR|nr:hypothetical protein CVT26_008105 [Gymnopilus dilepis]
MQYENLHCIPNFDWLLSTKGGARGVYCLLCKDTLKHCEEHANTTKHRENAKHLARLAKDRLSTRSPSPTAQTHPHQNLSASALSHLLYTLAYPPKGAAAPSGVPLQPSSPSPPRPSAYNWNLYEANNDGMLQDSAERRAVSMITQGLHDYLENDSISSADELAERSEEDEFPDGLHFWFSMVYSMLILTGNRR